MYLSHLLIDIGNNPDRPRPGRIWLRNIYHVHQRLSMAFPSRGQIEHAPDFLQPFDPSGFERPHFLFRIDAGIEGHDPRVMVLVQSELRPDWDYAFMNAGMFLAAPPEVRDYNPLFTGGDEYRFRIHINLSKKSAVHRIATDGMDEAGRPRTQGRRVAFTWDKDTSPDVAIREWFSGKGVHHGFRVNDVQASRLGWVAGYQPKSGMKMKFRSVMLEGTLAVTDASAFTRGVLSGIGSAKAFGF